MADHETITLTHAAARELAERLTKPRNGETLALRVAMLELDALTAGRLIAVMLHQTHSSDRWELPEVQP